MSVIVRRPIWPALLCVAFIALRQSEWFNKDRFITDASWRRAAYLELCAQIGIAPEL